LIINSFLITVALNALDGLIYATAYARLYFPLIITEQTI